jgi:ferredoxin
MSSPTVVLSKFPPEESATLSARFETLLKAFQMQEITVVLVDSIYDQSEDSSEVARLQKISGDMIFVGWHYPRALKWILARQNLEVNGATRRLHCLDAREPAVLSTLVTRVCEIMAGRESAEVQPLPNARGIGLRDRTGGQATSGTHVANTESEWVDVGELAPPENAEISQRWYPVIDYDQCTNCMECMDFCLFGVYGVDVKEILRVVQQDQCRADCPACSRVCPVGAIVFPKYKTNQTIAGAMDGKEGRGEIKLDLSKIFGKGRALHQAALERDRELLKAGRLPSSALKIEKLSDAIDQMEV